jgi:hypothetical protein
MKQTIKVKLKKRKNHIRPIIGAGIFTSTLLGVFLAPKPVLAACDSSVTSAGTSITNQASVDYEDPDGTAYTQLSNTVEVQVAEIAGITVTSLGVADPNLASRNFGDTVNFEFLVTNTGNDPTYIFLPGSANIAVVGGTAGALTITESTAPDGTVTAVGIAIPAAGDSTENLAGLPNTVGGQDGVILPGQSLTIQVPVTITETRATFPVSVQYGNTAPNDNSSQTQNQALNIRSVLTVVPPPIPLIQLTEKDKRQVSMRFEYLPKLNHWLWRRY